MNSTTSYTRKSQIWILTLFILLFLSVVSYVNLIYNEYKVDQRINQFRGENERIAKENKDKQLALVRLTLPKVIEKDNKTNLNKIRAGERVVVIEEDETKNFVLTQQKKPAAQPVSAAENKYEGVPNPERWLKYSTNK